MAAVLAGLKVVLIGGTRGIGFATAQATLSAGAEVVVASRDPSSVARAREALSAQAGRAVHGAALDVTDRPAVRAFVAAQAPFDHLCLPGSQAYRASFDDLDERAARDFFDSKFWGPFLAVHDARSCLRRGGSVVLYSGAASRRPLPGYVVGAAIDGAVDALTRSLAGTLAADGIRVNCISPGLVETDVTRMNRTEAQFQAWRDHHASRLPVGRIGRPEEAAQAGVFLMSNGFVNGHVLHLDGGVEAIA